MSKDSIKYLLFKLADDELVIGHRNSEWTGIGPTLEEDIAFSSMAQDEVGHAQAFYQMLHEIYGESHPDQLGFHRSLKDFKSSHFTEHPIVDYAFSLVRHYLYDTAEEIRMRYLMKSDNLPLSLLAKKIYREEKYHQMHAQIWIKQLGNATEESNRRMQTALNIAWPMAFSMFEPSEHDAELAKLGFMPKEDTIEQEWEEICSTFLTESGLKTPTGFDKTSHYGGRKGKHSEFLQPMLKEMTEVFSLDPTAKW